MQWDYNEEELNEYFSVSWIDHPAKQGVSFSEERNSNIRSKVIGCYVFEVGKSEAYIIAKQHPSSDNFCRNPNQNITNYFIIENINLEHNGDYTVYGPMDSIKFEVLQKELEIEDLEFSISFPEDPEYYGKISEYM